MDPIPMVMTPPGSSAASSSEGTLRGSAGDSEGGQPRNSSGGELPPELFGSSGVLSTTTLHIRLNESPRLPVTRHPACFCFAFIFLQNSTHLRDTLIKHNYNYGNSFPSY